MIFFWSTKNVHKIRCKMLTHTPVNPTIYSARVLQITVVHNKSLAEGMVSSEKEISFRENFHILFAREKCKNFRFFQEISHKSVSQKMQSFRKIINAKIS